jgi:hypothetical protein
VAVLVLEEVSPGNAVTARATEDTPETAAPGVNTADSGSAANRLLWRVQAGELNKTVLSKPADGTPADATQSAAQPTQAPAQHIGPVELVWPGASEHKAPAPAHE